MRTIANQSAHATALINELIPLLRTWAKGPHGSATPLRGAHEEMLTQTGELLNTVLSRVIDDSLGNDWPGPITNHER